MLVIGTQIQVLKSGATSCIEDLDPGSLIYNPLSDTHMLVLDILKRQVIPANMGHQQGLCYAPVRIPARAFDTGWPFEDLVVSSEQVVLISKIKGTAVEVNEVSASLLCETGKARREVGRINLPITYFVPLFSSPSVFCANGAMLVGCSADQLGVSNKRGVGFEYGEPE